MRYFEHLRSQSPEGAAPGFDAFAAMGVIH